MTPGELLHKLEQTGIEFRVDGDKLKVRGSLTDEIRELIRKSKQELLAELKRRDKFKNNPDPSRWQTEIKHPDYLAAYHSKRWPLIKDPITGLFLWQQDPRPDIQDDHDLWVEVLITAYRRDGRLHGVLHGFRCAGCKLVEEDGRLKLKGNYPEYAEDRRKWLMPMKEAVMELFREIEDGNISGKAS